jgi:hypothetical protein
LHFGHFFGFLNFGLLISPLTFKASFYIHMLIYVGCSNPGKDRIFFRRCTSTHIIYQQNANMNVCRAPLKEMGR